MKKYVLAGLAALLLVPTAARASEPQSIGEFGKWTAYTFEENGGTVCYMVAKPEKSEGKYSKRGEVAALITHRPKEGAKNVFSFMTGYAYAEGSKVELAIDGKKFTLFTKNDMAWATDASDDAQIAQALQKGSKMTISGSSARGTKTKDTFSLKGSTKAYQEISKACGYSS